MSLFIFSTSLEGAGARLERILEQRLTYTEIEVLRTVEDLSIRLSKAKYDSDIAILLASNKSELEELIFFGDLLDRIRIILILLDSKPELLSKGHLLKPRFITDSSCDFIDVAAVLKKMMDVKHARQDIHKAAEPTTIRHFEIATSTGN